MKILSAPLTFFIVWPLLIASCTSKPVYTPKPLSNKQTSTVEITRTNEAIQSPLPSETTTAEGFQTAVARIRTRKTVSAEQTQAVKNLTATVIALTPSPTKTQPPTSTPTRTPHSGIVEIPSWARNPANNLIKLTYENPDGSRPVKIGLMNPSTGEIIFIELEEGTYFHYWKDAQHIVFFHGLYCDDPPITITELDLSQGTLKKYDAQERTDLIRKCFRNDDEEKLARIVYDEGENKIMITNPGTGREVQLTDSSDGVTDVTFLISPNKKFIAVAQSTNEFEFSEVFRKEIGNQISIFKLSNQDLVYEVNTDEDFWALEFFPDNDKIFYMQEKKTCIMTLSSQSHRCLENISAKFPDAFIFPSEITSDSKKISFVYMNEDPRNGGLCIYDLISDTIFCPTDNFEALKGYIIANNYFSPDEQYILFAFDKKGCPMPYCDYFFKTYLAVMDVDGTELHIIGDFSKISGIDFYQFDFRPAWRPIEVQR